MASTSTRSAASDVRTNAGRTADATDELVESLGNDARNLLTDAAYATLGTVDLALSATAAATRYAIGFPGEVFKTVTDTPQRVRDEFEDLADRGKSISARIQGNEQWQEAIADMRTARRRSQAAARSGLEAVEEGADAITGIARSGARRAEATAKTEVRSVKASAGSANRGHSGGNRYEDRTVEELHDLAADKNIEGRSSMNKEQLIEAIRAS